MKTKMVRYEVDLDNLPPLTDAEREEVAAPAAKPDSEIDFSDIPPLNEEFFQNAVRGRFYRPVKTSTTVRVDADVLHWLRSKGKGYQTRLNAILRIAMVEELKTVRGTSSKEAAASVPSLHGR